MSKKKKLVVDLGQANGQWLDPGSVVVPLDIPPGALDSVTEYNVVPQEFNHLVENAVLVTPTGWIDRTGTEHGNPLMDLVVGKSESWDEDEHPRDDHGKFSESDSNDGDDTPLLNIGMDIPGGGKLTEEQIQAAVVRHGGRITHAAFHQSDSERTAVLRLDEPLDDEHALALSTELQQEAIVQLHRGKGQLHGPQKDKWGEYNPEYFVLPSGRRASALQKKSLSYDQLRLQVAGFVFKGGPGSGNFGHAGRPGEVGGSADDSVASAPENKDAPVVNARALPFATVGKTRNSDFAKLQDDEHLKSKLSARKQALYGKTRELPSGTPVALRIDVPAYVSSGVYAVTIHAGTGGKSVGETLGYDSMVRLSGEVRFVSDERGAQKVRSDERNKYPLATVKGQFDPSRELPADLDSWTSVGYNPEKLDFFYDKRTGQEVTGGVDAMSIGNTVFVRTPVYGERKATPSVALGYKPDSPLADTGFSPPDVSQAYTSYYAQHKNRITSDVHQKLRDVVVDKPVAMPEAYFSSNSEGHVDAVIGTEWARALGDFHRAGGMVPQARQIEILNMFGLVKAQEFFPSVDFMPMLQSDQQTVLVMDTQHERRRNFLKSDVGTQALTRVQKILTSPELNALAKNVGETPESPTVVQTQEELDKLLVNMRSQSSGDEARKTVLEYFEVDQKLSAVARELRAKVLEPLKAETPSAVDIQISDQDVDEDDHLDEFRNRARRVENFFQSIMPEDKFQKVLGTPVRINLTNDTYAGYQPDKDLIQVNPKLFTEATIAHEIGHLISHRLSATSNAEYFNTRGTTYTKEVNNSLRSAVHAFMYARAREYPELYSAYGDPAFIDEFADRYSGKVYTDTRHAADMDETELLSTGVEWLYKDPVRFARNYPEHFKLTVAFLQGKLHDA